MRNIFIHLLSCTFKTILHIFAWTVTLRESLRHCRFANQSRHLQVIVLLRVINKCSSFDRCLIILAVHTFTMRSTQNTLLETFTILFEASRFLASTSFCVYLFSNLFILIQRLTLTLICGWQADCKILRTLLLSRTSCRVYLRSESIRCFFKSLLYSLLSQFFILKIILTGIAIANTWITINSRSKALTIQFQTL